MATTVGAQRPEEAAVDAALVARLVRSVTAGARPELHTTSAPWTGQPLADLPMSTPDDVATAYDVQGVAAVHRVGSLDIGDVAVVVATTSAHRGTSFDASRLLIDTLKAEVPIWKHQRFTDGSEEWVGSP